MRDDARFYRIEGEDYPSVTTILSVLAKPALIPWAANQERRHYETAMLTVAERLPDRLRSLTPAGAAEWLLEEVVKAVTGQKAAEREKQRAATIGQAAHALIEWHTRRMLGEDAGPEPRVPDAAQWAVMAWQDWAKAVDFTPLTTERVVYCHECGYAGTLDFIAKVQGVVTLGDYKTAKAIYPEAFLQNRAYRHAARKSEGLETDQGVILRLPKEEADPAFEAMLVPETPLEDFLAALRLWAWQRRMSGQRGGNVPHGAHGRER